MTIGETETDIRNHHQKYPIEPDNSVSVPEPLAWPSR